jgi:hypothetical protein
VGSPALVVAVASWTAVPHPVLEASFAESFDSYHLAAARSIRLNMRFALGHRRIPFHSERKTSPAVVSVPQTRVVHLHRTDRTSSCSHPARLERTVGRKNSYSPSLAAPSAQTQGQAAVHCKSSCRDLWAAEASLEPTFAPGLVEA